MEENPSGAADGVRRGQRRCRCQGQAQPLSAGRGYEAKEVTQIIEQDPATGTQRVSKTQVTTKHIVPDTMACMYWLNNRSKGEFSQRQEVTLGGSVRTSPMEKLTEDELRSLARLDEEPDAEK